MIPEKRKEYLRNKRANGICYDCLEPALPGKTRCQIHMERSKNATKKSYEKRGGKTSHTKEQRARYNRWQKYGLTEDQYLELLGEGVCELCGGTEKLSIDHCHSTGKVRGLLCHGCNAGIGFMRENIIALENAITYLKRHKYTNQELETPG